MVKAPENYKDYLETLRIMASYLGPQRSFRSNLEFFLQLLAKRHDFMRAHLVLFEPETGLLRLRHAYSSQEVNEVTYSPGVGVTGQVFATGKSIIVEKLKDDKHFLSLLFNRTEEEMEKLAFISVPVLSPVEANPMTARDILGTLNVDTMGGDRDDLEWRCLFLEVVASLIANGSAYLQEEISRLWRVDSAVTLMQEDTGNYFLFSKIMRHLAEQASPLA
ncbi:MAG: GAF domain-containing protein, partial [Mailhella sp.]|nr:GAF domain-containing protein [Mailhella sp.]